MQKTCSIKTILKDMSTGGLEDVKNTLMKTYKSNRLAEYNRLLKMRLVRGERTTFQNVMLSQLIHTKI